MKIPLLKQLRWLRTVRDFAADAARWNKHSAGKELCGRLLERGIEIESVFQVPNADPPRLRVVLKDGSAWGISVSATVVEAVKT